MTNTTESGLVEIWADFVDWPKRKAGEAGFIKRNLAKHGCRSVYDLCVGGGFDSIELLLTGFDVTSNEVDDAFLELANRNAEDRGVSLSITRFDWRELPPHPEFDSAIMMGNSLIYMPDPVERQKVICNVYGLLNPGGVFIIDRRNFEYILSEREEILRGNFRYSREFVYCGEHVNGYPVAIEDKGVLFEYLDKRTGKKYNIMQYPVMEEEMNVLLRQAGFREVNTYYDYKEVKPAHHDFTQHVAVK
jgi:glycine/sarcosine N-methyltransferase